MSFAMSFHNFESNILINVIRKNRLTRHDGIPEGEVWVKIGSNKGGGSFKIGGDQGGPFKMSFQICYVPQPNSVENTCLLHSKLETLPPTFTLPWNGTRFK